MINCAVILAWQGEFVEGKVNQTGSALHTKVIIICMAMCCYFVYRSTASFPSLGKQCHLQVYYKNNFLQFFFQLVTIYSTVNLKKFAMTSTLMPHWVVAAMQSKVRPIHRQSRFHCLAQG